MDEIHRRHNSSGSLMMTDESSSSINDENHFGISVNEQQDDDDDNVLLPLMMASSDDDDETYNKHARRRRRRVPLELARRRILTEDRDTLPTTCLGDTWRLGASVGLASLVALLLFLGSRSTSNDVSSHMPPWPSEERQCVKGYNVSFSEIWERLSSSPDDMVCTTTKQEQPCSCHNPLVPLHYKLQDARYREKWDEAFDRNINRSQNDDNHVDVVFLGDSITEHFVQSDLGHRQEQWKGVRMEFDELFDKTQGAHLQGLPLGIAGDGCSQLLFRMTNGEIPSTLNPKVWWIEIGTNDLTDHCSAESVLMGILQVVRTVQAIRPGVPVVINSILPRGAKENNNSLLFRDEIEWINERLSCYAKGEGDVTFMDATRLFLSSTGGVDLNLLGDSLHPSANGTRVWGREIVKTVKGIIAK